MTSNGNGGVRSQHDDAWSPDDGIWSQLVDDTSVELRTRIAASPETVWTFWTEPARMCEWWGVEAELDPRPGGIFRVAMDGDGPTMHGGYVTLEPPHRLVFTFGWEASNDEITNRVAPATSTVEVILTATGHETDLFLRHTELPDRSTAESHREGWRHFAGGALRSAVLDASS